jgi:carbon-monoxide dehydrogenase medium subunit
MAVVGIAVTATMRGANFDEVRIGVTGVAQYAYRAAEVENALRGKPASAIAAAADHVTDGIEALSDTFASSEYRAHVARVYTRRALQECATQAKK